MGNEQNKQEKPRLKDPSFATSPRPFKFQNISSPQRNDDLLFLVKDGPHSFKKFVASAHICRSICSKFRVLVDRAVQSSDERIAYVSDIDARYFFLILKYFYFGECEVSPKHVLPFRKVAYRFKIVGILEVLDETIMQSLSVHNFCEIFTAYSQMNDFQKICCCLKCLPFLSGEHLEILNSKWFVLMKLDPGLRTLIQSKLLRVPPAILWNRCLDWVDYQIKSKRPRVLSLEARRKLRTCVDSFSQEQVSPLSLTPVFEEPYVHLQKPRSSAALSLQKPVLVPERSISASQYISGSLDSQVDCQDIDSMTG